MPNDLTAKRNLLNSRDDVRSESQRQKLTSSGFTASIWTISGVVLVACGNIEDFLGIDDGGGGGGGGRSVHVQSSAVQGARIYFDTDGGGVGSAERAAQDALYPEGFITDATGEARGIPAEFYGKPFIADLRDAINVETGEVLSGTLRSIPDANGDHTLASPITEYIESEGGDPKEVVADLINAPDAESAEVQAQIRLILDSRSYLGGNENIEALSVFLAEENSPTRDDAGAFLVGDDATQNPETLFVADADISKTIGADADAGTNIATIHAVSHGGSSDVGYSIVESDGTTPITGGDFNVDSRTGVVSVADGVTLSTGMETIYVRVSNGDSAETVTIDVTIMEPAVELTAPSGTAGTIEENDAGAIAVEGIETSDTVDVADFTISDALGVTAGYASMFEIVAVTGATNTWNLKLIDGMDLDFETIPNGVINLRVHVEQTGNAPSNILEIAVTVTDDPDDIAFSGVVRGEVTKDSGEYEVSGTITIANQPSGTTVDAADGTYGTLSFDSGTWTYTLTNTDATVQRLLEGQLLIDTAELTVGSETQSIFIIINGANEDVRFEDNGARVSTADVPTDIEIGTTTALDGSFALGNIFMDLGISLEGQLATSSDPTVEFADSVSANLRGMFSLSASGDLEFTGTNAEALVLGVSTISLDLLVNAPEDTTEQIPLNLQVNIVNNDDDGRAEYEITGDVEANQTLTVSRVQGTEEDPDGVVGAVVFQWFRGDEGTPTLLSTGSTYRVTQADIASGDSIGVFVRYTDGSGTTYTNTDGDDTTTIVAFASPVKFATPTEAELMAPENDADWTLTVTATSEDSDSDGSDSVIASYEILEVLDASGADVTSDGIFTIADRTMGVISISAALDYEMSASYTLRIQATDTPEAESVVPGDTADTGTTTLTVNVQDVNEHAPAFVTNAEDSTLTDGTEEIAEDVANGHRVGLVRATDADGTNNVVTYTLDDGGAGVFGIRAVTGTDDWEIYVLDNTNLDFDGSTKSYTLTITATDSDTNNPMTTTETVTITLTDVNDVVPMVTPPPQSGVFRVRTTDGLPAAEIAQNSAAGTGYRITIDDADTNNVFTFNVSDPRFDFQAQGSADVTWELMLLAGQAVTEEEGDTITLTYHVNDGVANSVNVGQTTVTINVVDTPVEFAPVTAAALMADENDADWTLTVMATSLGSNSDGGDSVIASYEIVEVLDENDMVVASDGVFTIADRTIGKISISAGLDYETSASYTLVIRATDTVESAVPGDTADTNTARFTINLRDVNEHNPVFFTKDDDPDLVAHEDTVELAENAAAGTVVAQVRAMDADGTSTVEYGITAGAGGNFVIDEETGVITVASGATLDYDGATKSYTILVRAYDGPSSDPNAAESDEQQITINLTDVNDNPPMVTAPAGEIRTTTGNAADTPTGYSITVTDADTVGTLMVDSDDERFRFDRDGTTDTWNLILLANQAVTAGTISLGYSATDGDNPPATGTITLMAVDTPVKFTAPAAADLIITENDSTNAWTVTITATSIGSDSDGSDSAISGYEILEVLDADGMTVDMNGVFSITDAGVISVSGALDHETSAYYTLRIEATDTVESGVSGDTADTGTTDLRVNVGDVNEADPVIEGSPTADAFVTTGATDGTEVTTVVVTDADTSQTFTYAITSGNAGDAFAIDDNGVITVASGTTLDRATTATYDLVVTVTDNGVDANGAAATKSDTQNIKVTVREEPPTPIAEQVQGASVQSGTDAADVIDRSTQTGFEVIQGGDLSDTITVGSGGSVVFGGYGSDAITLGDGVDTVVHRFASVKGIWRNDDGADVIRDFELGKDKFILVDTDDNPIDLTTFLDETISGSHSILGPDDMQPIAERGAAGVLIRALPDLDADDLTYIGVAITISTPVKQDGPGGEDPNTAAIEIQIYWDESFVIDPNGTPDADNYERFLGIVDLVGFTGGQLNLENDFTDYSILPTYLNDDDTTRGFDVISLDDLGVEII